MAENTVIKFDRLLKNAEHGYSLKIFKLRNRQGAIQLGSQRIRSAVSVNSMANALRTHGD